MSEAISNSIQPLADGPLKVCGDIELVNADGEVLRRETEVYLCRCGESTNKPFCDGSHSGCGYAEPGAVGASKAIEPETTTGPIQIRLAVDGPILCNGPLEIVDGEGGSFRSVKAALCRCGQSQNGPFCDGGHKPAGFHAGAEIEG